MIEPDLITLVYFSKVAASERARLKATIRSILTVSQHRNA